MINEYVSKKLQIIKDKEINRRLSEFREKLKHHAKYINDFVDSTKDIEETKDLFLSEVAKTYASNFEIILSAFTDNKLKKTNKSLFNKFK